MPLQPSGQISIADICGANGLNIGFNPPARSLSELANLANTASLPYANRATPSLFDWYSYNHVVTPTTVTLEFSVVTQTSVNLTWSTHIGQDGFVVAGYRVFQNGVQRGGDIPSNVNNFSDNTLVVNTNYSYYVQAFNAGGTTINSNTVTFYNADITPPNAFTVGSIVQTLTSIEISWELNGDNVGVVAYDVYKNGGFVGRRTPPTKSYNDTGLPPNSSYQYYVIAIDQAGNQRQSNTITVSTLADTTPPAPFTLTAGATTPNSNTFSWNLTTDDVGVVEYDVYANDLYQATVSNTTTSYTHNFTIANSTWNYHIKAIDGARNKRDSNYITMTYVPPAPTNIPIAYFGNNSILGETSTSFNASRNNGVSVSSGLNTSFDITTARVYTIKRCFMGFNCSAVHNPTSAKISINVVGSPVISVAIVATTTVFPPNHVWTPADFSSANGGTLVSDIKAVTSAGNWDFIFNSAGLAYINGNGNCTFALVENYYDRLNNGGTPNNSHYNLSAGSNQPVLTIN